MPILLAFVPEIGDALSLVTLGGAVGGSVATYCNDNPGVAGCVHSTKRDILGTASVPQMTVRQAATGPCGVPMYNFDQCKDEVAAATVRVVSSIPAAGVAQFDNVPAPACMDLVAVMTATCDGDGPRPVVCGTNCVQYTGLTADQFGYLSQALNAA